MNNNEYYDPYQPPSGMQYQDPQYQQPQFQQPAYQQPQYQQQQPQYQQQYMQQQQVPQLREPQMQGSYHNPYQNQFVQPLTPEYSVQAYRNYLSKMESAATLWLIIGIIQIVIGVFTAVIIWGFVLIGIGIWNIVQSSSEKKAVRHFRQTSSGITRFVDTQSSGIGALLVNIFLGAWLGIIAAAMDMSARTYGQNNRAALLEVEKNGWL
ncbi:MAG: hypothetical protein K6F55_05585 [Eubacterium sp.]|nr:hypothetical protein [Eubacterium sp.]